MLILQSFKGNVFNLHFTDQSRRMLSSAVMFSSVNASAIFFKTSLNCRLEERLLEVPLGAQKWK